MAKLSSLLIAPTSIEDISVFVYEHAVQLTGSQFGYVGYMDPNTGYLVCPTMTADLWRDGQGSAKGTVFRHFGGLWGWVLENRRSLLTNDPAGEPRSLGGSQGRLPVRRFLSAPPIVPAAPGKCQRKSSGPVGRSTIMDGGESDTPGKVSRWRE